MKAHITILAIGMAWFGAFAFADAQAQVDSVSKKIEQCTGNLLREAEKQAQSAGIEDGTHGQDEILFREVCEEEIYEKELDNCAFDKLREERKSIVSAQIINLFSTGDMDEARATCRIEMADNIGLEIIMDNASNMIAVFEGGEERKLSSLLSDFISNDDKVESIVKNECSANKNAKDFTCTLKVWNRDIDGLTESLLQILYKLDKNGVGLPSSRIQSNKVDAFIAG